MRYTYPCLITPDEDGWLLATFPDIPEAGTSGKDTDDIVALAEDALAVALAGYVNAKRDIPKPSNMPARGHLIPVTPVVAAKLALYTTMRQTNTSNVALAAKLNISEVAVRRLINPDHRSHIGPIKRALAVMGRKLVVEDVAA